MREIFFQNPRKYILTILKMCKFSVLILHLSTLAVAGGITMHSIFAVLFKVYKSKGIFEAPHLQVFENYKIVFIIVFKNKHWRN